MRSLGSKSGNTLARELIEDVIDTLRSLRCADALRQRGTVLKTSGNCEIFVDQRTANAIYALRPDDQHLCLLEIPDQINAGEANLSSQLDADGNLRISFYHGMFTDQETVLKAARCVALVVNDIQEDAIGSFERSDGATHPELKRRADVSIFSIESVNENPAFADLVRWELQLLKSGCGQQGPRGSLARGRLRTGAPPLYAGHRSRLGPRPPT